MFLKPVISPYPRLAPLALKCHGSNSIKNVLRNILPGRGGQHGASRAVAGAESAHHHPHRSEADCHQACGGTARVD